MQNNPLRFRERTYRNKISRGRLFNFQIQFLESDLWISASRDLSSTALDLVYHYRHIITGYIESHPNFLTSFIPLKFDPLAPPIIRDMLSASNFVGVGPMASVAGAIAQYVGDELALHSNEVIVENGGDIFIKSQENIRIAIFAGSSPLSENVFLKISSEKTPLGVCTSSGTVGHSVSLGLADAVCVISKSAILADAAATAIGNSVKSSNDIKKALESGLKIEGVLGLVIVVGDKLGVLGDVELD